MGSLFSSSKKETKEEVSTAVESIKDETTSAVSGSVFRVDSDKIHNRACFGAGCYWGTEKYFKINFARTMYPESMLKNTFVGKSSFNSTIQLSSFFIFSPHQPPSFYICILISLVLRYTQDSWVPRDQKPTPPMKRCAEGPLVM
jgi:hypothetical protein